MVRGLFCVLLVLLLMLSSGCTARTGRIVDDAPNLSEMVPPESHEDAHLESGKAEPEIEVDTSGEDNASVNITSNESRTTDFSERSCETECGECEILVEENCSCAKRKECCGNDFCEKNETPETCPADCPLHSVILTEVVYDTEKPENRKEWFEIYNPTEKTFELGGYSVSDNDYRWEFPEGTVIGPGNYLTVSRSADGFYEEYGCYPDMSGFSRTMNNGGDQLVLRDKIGNIIDFVSWLGFSEGWDIFADEGRSIKRISPEHSDFPDNWKSNGTALPAGCDSVECPHSVRECPDGHVAECENAVIGDECTECEPDCSGHEAPECVESWVCSEWGECIEGLQSRSCTDMNSCGSEADMPNETRSCFYCNISCSLCEIVNTATCSCEEISPCEGNGICEEGEYGGPDCPDCDDGDVCTQDYYNYSNGNCSHTNIVPCCGDGKCEGGESETSCPEDCEKENSRANWSHIIFSKVMYDPEGKESETEWIELYNPVNKSLNLSGWTIRDNSGEWTFPGNASACPSSYFMVSRDSTAFSEMFNCTPDAGDFTKWLNNDGDQLWLKNTTGETIDFVAWEGGNGSYPGWGISAGEGEVIERVSANVSVDSWVLSEKNWPSGC